MAEIKELWQIARDLLGEQELSRLFRQWIGNLIRKARMKQNNSDNGVLFDDDVSRVLADLNRRTKSRFGATDQAMALIGALLKKGYAPEDFFKVHEIKCLQWWGNEKMEHCLRPSTLYRPSHFDEYLAEWWRMDRKRQSIRRRREAVNRVPVIENAASVEELMQIPWYGFETWAQLVKHTCKFPDPESMKKYPMPDRVREMRMTPGMMLWVLGGKIEKYEWAEELYKTLKEVEDV